MFPMMVPQAMANSRVIERVSARFWVGMSIWF